MACDGCGSLTDVEPLNRPEGWITVFRKVDGANVTRDFCEWGCFVGWTVAHDETTDGYLQAWQESIAIIKATKELVK